MLSRAGNRLALFGLIVLGTVLWGGLAATLPEPRPALAAPGDTVRVNLSSTGAQIGGPGSGSAAEQPAISADGRFVAFMSTVNGIVPEDTNNAYDLYLRDRTANTTTRIGVATDGTAPGNGTITGYPSISDDGRYIVFASQAPLVQPDSNGTGDDIYLRDRVMQTTTRISVDSAGMQVSFGAGSCAGISGDGKHVAFTHSGQVYVRDLVQNTTSLVSRTPGGTPGNGNSSFDCGSWGIPPRLSRDGRRVVFASQASDLVIGDTNSAIDVFVYDRDSDNDNTFDEAGATAMVRASVANLTNAQSGNNQQSRAAAISPDGRYVVFESAATNFVGTATTGTQVFLRDLQMETTTLVSAAPNGAPANLAFGSSYAQVSENGRYVAFVMDATNLVSSGQGGIFLRDMQTGVTTLESKSSAGVYAGNVALNLQLTPDAKFLVFMSTGSGFVPNDTNSAGDIFVREPASRSAVFAPSLTTNTDPINVNVARTWSLSVQNTGLSATDGSTVTASVTVPDNYDTVTAPSVNGWTCAPPSDKTATCTRAGTLNPPMSYPALTVSAVARSCGYVAIATAAVSGGGAASPGAGSVLSPVLCSAPPQSGISVVGAPLSPGNIPSVPRGAPFPLTAVGVNCPDGTATVTVLKNGQVVSTSNLTHQAGSAWAGTIAVNVPGPVQVVIRIDCPEEQDTEYPPFDLYIDPSGYVKTPGGDPVVGATVTLYRSDSIDGPFTQVPNQSAIMSPQNRTNPDLTDGTGHFGWDVIPGYYKVQAFKSGCGSAVETQAYEIPPPVLDIDLRLNCPSLTPQITGKVTLQGRTNLSPGTVMAAGHGAVQVRLDGGPPISVAADGSFALTSVAAGMHTLTASAPGYLSVTSNGNLTSGTLAMPLLVLPAGRVTADAKVDIQDIVALIAAFGRSTSDRTDGAGNIVDLNGDGIVNLRDLTLALGNFGKSGPLDWP